MPNDKKIPNVPNLRFKKFLNNWSREQLKNISKKLTYGLSASAINFDGKHKYIRITDISNWGEEEIKSPSFYSSEFILNEGDILLARTGATVGDSFIYKSDNFESYYAGFLIRAIIKNHNPYFIYYQLKRDSYWRWVKIQSARSGQPGINSEQFGNYIVSLTSKEEETIIVNLLNNITNRIETQNKIIEDYIMLISEIRNKMFNSDKYIDIDSLIEESFDRNKHYLYSEVYSVNNKLGFVKQTDQFEGRELASKNKKNYKIVVKNTFAYNPARINVGSLALYTNSTPCIISPMYLCFKLKSDFISPQILLSFFRSKTFFHQLANKLEGSVRQCLTIQSLKNLKMPFESYPNLYKYQNLINVLIKKINYEKRYLNRLISQKKYLLNNLFI